MPFDDLDLEFEDEEESKKKKKEAVDIDVDLDFSVNDSRIKTQANVKQPQAGSGNSSAPKSPPSQPSAAPPAQVRKIDDARAQAQAKRPATPQVAVGSDPQPRVVGTSAVKENPAYDLESQSVVEMREQMKKMELETQVKVAVAEFKTDYLSEMLSDVKLLDHQINQLLIRINAKHPDMKNEVLMIKKLLADFSTKKRK